MKVIRKASELDVGTRKVCVAIGVFDGVHLGHQQVIRQTIADAQQFEGISAVVTFDCHPNSVVAPDRAPQLIYPLGKKMSVIESLGVDTTLLIHFDKTFSAIPAEDFVRQLATDFRHIQSICVGSNFTFGHKRGGNVDLLKKLGAELHFAVHGLSAVSLDGERVSSTRIRHAIRSGDLDSASQMLGRPYSLVGTVMAGDKLGRTLGFPTANLDVRGLVLPPNGVYAAHAKVGGEIFRAAVNVGVRPTLGNPVPELRVEAHLLEFSRDIYGQEIELAFVAKLRDEQKFPSAEALKAQIRSDMEALKAHF